MYLESYKCGCSFEAESKSLLLGYCSKHGESRNLLLCLNRCLICSRETPLQFLEKHHLKPKRGKECIQVCCDCADQIHKIFSNKELEIVFNSLDSLLASEKIQTWVKWIRKKKSFGVCMKSKKKK